MIINGVELKDLDIFDLEVAENYDIALKKIEVLEASNKNVSMAEMIKINCNAIFDVFNLMFGEGTDKKVFGDKVNLLTCMKAFKELVSQMNDKKSEIEKLTNEYSANRVARRTKK